MTKRVVVTGMGIVSPNGTGKVAFEEAIKKGKSGITHLKELESLNFACQIGGIPNINNSPFLNLIDDYHLQDAGYYTKYAVLAAIEAWTDAGLPIPQFSESNVDADTGLILGTGVGAIDLIGHKTVPYVNSGKIKQLRSSIVEYMMFSGPAAILSGILSLGNHIMTNSSACASSSESIILGYDHIKQGKALRMIVGGAETFTPYAWAGFDAMRVSTRSYNDKPELASRPMSASASGFVPAAGAAFLVLEELNTALKRQAPIYAEVAGGACNAGGQRNGGSITAMNPVMARKCIESAIKSANIKPQDITLISGHLTSTIGDITEVKCWVDALNLSKTEFPLISSLKSMTGHLIGAAGTLETAAACLQIKKNFIHPSINCQDIHPEIRSIIDFEKIPQTSIFNKEVNAVIKVGFGFGDVNACLILKKFISL
ncbi:MAG: beta-ketoacyl-[acyl-carrier-protein] synthase family protein [Bacteroidales bacterium]|nr:beta-ketoacyl-[acyl-carrier-protein] synthase family protein [Bacteroidales bacterium]